MRERGTKMRLQRAARERAYDDLRTVRSAACRHVDVARRYADARYSALYDTFERTLCHAYAPYAAMRAMMLRGATLDAARHARC